MKSPTYEHGRRRGSVFRTSDWGETEAPGDTYLWDYAEVADDDDAEFSDEHLQDRLSSYESSPASSVASRRPTDDETDGLPMRRRYSSMWEWDYREVLPSPQHKAWDCRGLPRMQIRCYLRMLTEVGRVGDFIIRKKQDSAGYALTTKSNQSGDLLTYRIEMTASGQSHIHGCEADENFETVEALVDYYTAAPRGSIGAQLSVPVGLWPFEDLSGDPAVTGATGGWLQVQPGKRRKSNLAKVIETTDLAEGGEYIAIDGGDGEVDGSEAVEAKHSRGDRAVQKLTTGNVSVPTAAELRSLSALANDRIKMLKTAETARSNGHTDTKQIRLDGTIDEHDVLPALSVV